MEVVVSLRQLLLWLMIVIIMLLTIAEARQPVLHKVGGGKYTWAPNINVTDWASHEQFYVGDWLYFGFNKSRHNVLEVNKTSYERCIAQNFITNITKGGRDVFNLTEAKTYYFLCGFGNNCNKGMKLAVFVQTAPHELALPMTSTSGSPINTCRKIFPLLVFAIVWASLFKYF